MPMANMPGATRPIHPTYKTRRTMAVTIMAGALKRKVLIIMK
jgi:hypothetical protein